MDFAIWNIVQIAQTPFVQYKEIVHTDNKNVDKGRGSVIE